MMLPLPFTLVVVAAAASFSPSRTTVAAWQAPYAHKSPIYLPPLLPLLKREFDATHSFSRTANWLIPGRVLCGHYPGACPSRPMPPSTVAQDLAEIRESGICTFVCLQDELPPQDAPWPEGGVKKKSVRAKWAKGSFQNYRDQLDDDEELLPVRFVHFGLPDLSVASSLDELDGIVHNLKLRVENGDRLYIHCWGGRGRTGLVSACLLGALYGEIDAEQALARVQQAYSLRMPWREKISPETEEQRNQVRDWFSYKRNIAMCSRMSPQACDREPAFGIYDKQGTDILEVVSRSAIHPLTCAEAARRAGDAARLGNGRFGQVFRGRCEHTAERDPVAIKVSYYLADAPTHHQSRLALEASVLRAMSGHRGFPRILYDARQTVFGRPSDVLVMQLLGEAVQTRCRDQPAKEKTKQEEEEEEEGAVECTGDSTFTEDTVKRIGRDLIWSLRRLHEAGYVHNDLKPANMVFGAAGTSEENKVHLVDFGMVTQWRSGERQARVVDGCTLRAGGAVPMFASLAQLEGRPTNPADDLESLWYCLAWLVAPALPWQWEDIERVANIKRRLFIDECAVASDECRAWLSAEDCCSTQHCFNTADNWDVPDWLHELWSYVVIAHERTEGQSEPEECNTEQTEDCNIDYDSCLEALGDLG